MSSKASVKVTVGGEELTVRSELPPEYTREIAAYFDDTLRHIRTMLPSLEAHKAAILAGLAVTEELFRHRRTDGEIAARVEAMVEDLGRLLPPAKRGVRSASD